MSQAIYDLKEDQQQEVLSWLWQHIKARAAAEKGYLGGEKAAAIYRGEIGADEAIAAWEQAGAPMPKIEAARTASGVEVVDSSEALNAWMRFYLRGQSPQCAA